MDLEKTREAIAADLPLAKSRVAMEMYGRLKGTADPRKPLGKEDRLLLRVDIWCAGRAQRIESIPYR